MPARAAPEQWTGSEDQIGHLNFRTLPVSEDARGWPTIQLARELGSAVATFVNVVDDGKVAFWIQGESVE